MTIKYTITYKLNNDNNVEIITTSKDAVNTTLQLLKVDSKVTNIEVKEEEINNLSV